MAEGDNNPADSNPGGQGAEQPAGPQFGVTKTFVKDISFETPMGVKVFTQAFQPKIQLDVNSRGSAIADNTHEVVLTLTTIQLTCWNCSRQESLLFLVLKTSS